MAAAKTTKRGRRPRPVGPFWRGVASALDLFGVYRPYRVESVRVGGPRGDYLNMLEDGQRLSLDAQRALGRITDKEEAR